MFFEKLFSSLNKDQAYFRSVKINDVNTVSGTRKNRIVCPQSDTMKILQKRLRNWLRKQFVIRCPSATGSLPGSSPEKNVSRHRRKNAGGNYFFPRYFVLMDIQNAYTSVSLPKLAEIVCGIEPTLFGKEQEMLLFLKQYCSQNEAGLAVGAGASQDLFNIFCEVMIDQELRVLCEKHQITYTRYLDDMTFSSNFPIGKRTRRAIRLIIEKSGMSVNLKKIHCYDLKKGSITINGIGVDIDGNIFTPRHFTNYLSGLLHKVIYKNEEIDPRVVLGKINVFVRTLKVKGSAPNSTERKVQKLCDTYVILHKNKKEWEMV